MLNTRRRALSGAITTYKSRPAFFPPIVIISVFKQRHLACVSIVLLQRLRTSGTLAASHLSASEASFPLVTGTGSTYYDVMPRPCVLGGTAGAPRRRPELTTKPRRSHVWVTRFNKIAGDGTQQLVGGGGDSRGGRCYRSSEPGHPKWAAL